MKVSMCTSISVDFASMCILVHRNGFQLVVIDILVMAMDIFLIEDDPPVHVCGVLVWAHSMLSPCMGCRYLPMHSNCQHTYLSHTGKVSLTVSRQSQPTLPIGAIHSDDSGTATAMYPAQQAAAITVGGTISSLSILACMYLLCVHAGFQYIQVRIASVID